MEEDAHQEMEEVMSRALASMEEIKSKEEKMSSLSKEKAKAETREWQDYIHNKIVSGTLGMVPEISPTLRAILK